MIRKGLVVAVILLFIGLAFAPSINANISKASVDSELVEITTEICGIDGVRPNTLSLSKEEAEEIEELIDDIERRLNAVETRKEAEEIFNEAVVELDKYGLLCGLSVKQTQRLVTGRFYISKTQKLTREIAQIEGAIERNMFCLIAGNTTETYPLSLHFRVLVSYISSIFIILNFIANHNLLSDICIKLMQNPFIQKLYFIWEILFGFYGMVYLLSWEITLRCPQALHHLLILGHGDKIVKTSNGWVHTFGLNGKKNWSGNFLGQIHQLPGTWLMSQGFGEIYYPGVLGFTGVKLCFDKMSGDEWFYIGSALWVNIEEV